MGAPPAGVNADEPTLAPSGITPSGGPPSRWPAWLGRLRGGAFTRPLLLGEFAIVAALLIAYDRIKELADEEASVARRHAFDVVRVEKWLHVFVELHLDNGTARVHWLSVTASYYYQFVHIPATMAVLALCYVRWPVRYRLARNTLALTNVIGLATFVLYPVMPPRLLPGYGFHDAVADAGFGTSHVGGPIPEAQFAAMPSLHLAWATWVTVVLWVAVRNRTLRVLVLAYPVLMFLAVMATGNHYFLDGIAGIATTVVCAWAAWWWERRVRPATAPLAILPARAGRIAHAAPTG